MSWRAAPWPASRRAGLLTDPRATFEKTAGVSRFAISARNDNVDGNVDVHQLQLQFFTLLDGYNRNPPERVWRGARSPVATCRHESRAGQPCGSRCRRR